MTTTSNRKEGSNEETKQRSNWQTLQLQAASRHAEKQEANQTRPIKQKQQLPNGVPTTLSQNIPK
jgi:hypothetical protein